MFNKIKQIIRGVAVVFSFMFFGVGALIVRYLIFPINKLFLRKGENLKLKYSEILQKSWQFFVWILKSLRIIKIQSRDIDKLKNIKNSIIVSTHPSYIDILILMSIIPHSTCFVAERLMDNVFFKGIVKLLFINEGQSVDKWSEEASGMIDEGFNLIIFPMGIRHRKDEFPKIRRGTALLAGKTLKNIEMINMSTNFDFLQINQPIYKAGSETVVYSIEYRGTIDIQEFFNIYQDEVTFKTKLSKYIAKSLY